jgi:cation:H+ antiporter
MLVIGLVLLVKGVDWVVDSGAKIGRHFGVPSFIIGLTIVAMGTSAPEAAIGFLSGLKGANQVTLGDVIGSSIINITLIIGITAAIMPLKIDPLVSKREIPISFFIQFAVTGMLFTGLVLSRAESVLLLFGLAALIAYMVIEARRVIEGAQPVNEGERGVFIFLQKEQVISEEVTADNADISKVLDEKNDDLLKLAVVFSAGLATLILGANMVVDNSIIIALSLGLSLEFIGLTVVAFGTSLPELATCLVAVIRKETDIAVGNIIGSNIFNMLFVLGISGTISPISSDAEVFKDLGVMLMATLLLLIPALVKQNISRLSGFILMASYFVYMIVKVSALE